MAAWRSAWASFALTLLGPTFKLPDWALGSPLRHVPNITADSPGWTGLIALIAAAAALTVVAFAGYRHRPAAPRLAPPAPLARPRHHPGPPRARRPRARRRAPRRKVTRWLHPRPRTLIVIACVVFGAGQS